MLVFSYWVGQRTDLGHEVWVTIPILGVGETLNFKLPTEIRAPTRSRFQPTSMTFEHSSSQYVVYDPAWAFNPEFLGSKRRANLRL